MPNNCSETFFQYCRHQPSVYFAESSQAVDAKSKLHLAADFAAAPMTLVRLIGDHLFSLGFGLHDQCRKLHSGPLGAASLVTTAAAKLCSSCMKNLRSLRADFGGCLALPAKAAFCCVRGSARSSRTRAAHTSVGRATMVKGIRQPCTVRTLQIWGSWP